MSDYAWFAVKGIVMLCLIGFAVWITKSAWCLWGLCLMPSWTNDDKPISDKPAGGQS